ncbi:MAG: hypothetical protein E8A46_26405 [Bradyrhizobium sp.]|nr:MAG: hypothetical protein E8A46_26405 [Bradyrhizobium sp.]
MKDFYDIWMLSRASEFNDDRLARSNAATFARRNTSARISLRERFSKSAAALSKAIMRPPPLANHHMTVASNRSYPDRRNPGGGICLALSRCCRTGSTQGLYAPHRSRQTHPRPPCRDGP